MIKVSHKHQSTFRLQFISESQFFGEQ